MFDWLGASWGTLGRVAATTFVFYVTVFAALRLAGRRTLAQFSAFDFVITVAVGSLLAGTVLSASYARGLAALLTLLVTQQVVAVIRKRFPRSRRTLDFDPLVVVRDGEPDLRDSPTTAQVTEDELASKLRQRGIFDLSDVQLVILESDGQISIVPKDFSTDNESVIPERFASRDREEV